GTYTFGTTLTVKIQAVNSSSISTCADAVKFVQKNQPPTATMDPITPSPAQLGQSVSFGGSGSDPDGTVEAYEWSSDLDGVLSRSASFTTTDLSWGNHVISFRVQDDKGEWSTPVTQSLSVVHSVVVDNTDAATSKTGTW